MTDSNPSPEIHPVAELPHDLPPDLPHELPPVEPPTAGFIVQLFVIPAIIVALVVVVWLLFGKLAGGERDASDYVRTIRSENENRRWRAAHELASLIGNDPKLGLDSQLLGELTELLDEELAKQGSPRLKLYLAVTLGVFQTLDAKSPSGRPIEPLAVLARALAPSQAVEVRMAAAESLAKQAARLNGTLTDDATEQALADASSDSEPELRKRATYALGFFGGEPATKALRARLQDDDREVRYNAAIALARRDDASALAMLREMLTPTDLQRAVVTRNTKEERNQVEQIELATLQALQTAVKDGRPSLARLLRTEIAGLARSDLASVRVEAEAVLKALPAGTAISPDQ